MTEIHSQQLFLSNITQTKGDGTDYICVFFSSQCPILGSFQHRMLLYNMYEIRYNLNIGN
jgi:hypothetical protein